MDISIFALETAVIEHITPVLDALNFRVEQFPASAEEFTRVVQKARVFVGWRSSTLSRPLGVHPIRRIQQDRTLRFQILYQYFDLRNREPIMSAIAAVRDRLSGYSPPGQLPTIQFFEVEAGFGEVSQGIWMYSQIFEINIPYLKSL